LCADRPRAKRVSEAHEDTPEPVIARPTKRGKVAEAVMSTDRKRCVDRVMRCRRNVTGCCRASASPAYVEIDETEKLERADDVSMAGSEVDVKPKIKSAFPAPGRAQANSGGRGRASMGGASRKRSKYRVLLTGVKDFEKQHAVRFVLLDRFAYSTEYIV